MATCCSVLGLVLLVLTNLAVLIAFATPYWVVLNQGNVNQGLWAFCQGEQCTWIFQGGDYATSNQLSVDSDWFYSTVGLVSGGFCLTLFALLFATVSLCCDCRGCNASSTIGGMLVLAFLALAVAAAVFGVMGHQKDAINIGFFTTEQESGRDVGWSFWLDCGASGLALVTAMVYFIDGRNKIEV